MGLAPAVTFFMPSRTSACVSRGPTGEGTVKPVAVTCAPMRGRGWFSMQKSETNVPACVVMKMRSVPVPRTVPRIFWRCKSFPSAEAGSSNGFAGACRLMRMPSFPKRKIAGAFWLRQEIFQLVMPRSVTSASISGISLCNGYSFSVAAAMTLPSAVRSSSQFHWESIASRTAEKSTPRMATGECPFSSEVSCRRSTTGVSGRGAE